MERTEIEEPHEHRHPATKLWGWAYGCHPGKAGVPPAPAAIRLLCSQLRPPPLTTLGFPSGHRLLSAMPISMEVTTFRWRKTVLNLLWASSSSWVMWRVKRHLQGCERRKLQAAKNKMWVQAGFEPSCQTSDACMTIRILHGSREEDQPNTLFFS